MQARPPTDLCHNLAARRSARNITRLYDRYLAKSGLSISQFSILATIYSDDGILVAKLAQDMVMDRTTLVRALKPLELSGLLIRRAIRGSAARTLHLTAEGVAKVKEAAPHWRAAQEAFEADVGVERAVALRDTLLAIATDR